MRLLGLALLFFIFSIPVFAQSDTSEFNVRVFGGADITAPTTPVLLSATATTPTQVDLYWSTSTDNFSVAGYVVFRDSSPIATTTQISYSDTSLSASTTYNYFVQAFDSSSNYSSSSNNLNVTTPDFPAPPVEATSTESSGTVARVVADEVVVTPGYSTSSVYVKTPHPARFEIRWGRTASYELGYVVTDTFQSQYRTIITDLEPGTVYEYEIIGYTPFGKSNTVKQGRFTTLSSQDLLPPANVHQFVAVGEGSDVRLSWSLPDDSDLAYVRIVRSHLGFPQNPNDGAVVYQGLQSNTLDKNILSRYSPVYYTAFVIDGAGNVSSGAVSIVYADSLPGDNISTVDDNGEIIPIGTDGKTNDTTGFAGVMPELHEIFLVQGVNSYTFDDIEVRLLSNEDFLLTIPRAAVSKNIKSIIVTLQDPTDNRKTFSFLLRINKQQTAYEAVIAAVGVNGASEVSIDIYDFYTLVVASYKQRVQFVSDSSVVKLSENDPQKEFSLIWWFLLSIFGLLLILLWWIVSTRDDDEDKKR